MNKPIAILMAVYKRMELTRIILQYYAVLARKYNLVLIAVGSEGEESKKMCIAAGWNYIEHANQPLSKKINALFAETKNYNVRGAVWVGSDDLISEQVIQYYFEHFDESTTAVMNLESMHFYSVHKNLLLHYKFKEVGIKGYGMGPARYISKLILEKINYILCKEEHKRGIDLQHAFTFQKHGIAMQYFYPACQISCVDIKTDTVMSAWDFLYDHITTEAPTSLMYSYFPSGTITEIEQLRPLQTGNEQLLIGR